MRWNEKLFIRSGFVPCGRTDMTKLINAFRNFANAPKTREIRREGLLTLILDVRTGILKLMA